jgi:glucose 1-dehydrogenase
MSTLAPLLIVIGGSRGIGAAVVRRAVIHGYRIVIGYRFSRSEATNLANGLQADGHEVLALPVDVTDAESIEAFYADVTNSWGAPPAAMVYATGIAGVAGPLVDTPLNEVTRVLDTNLMGAFAAVQGAAKRMLRSRGGIGGSIVLISSEAAKFGGNHLSPYAASKAGINALVMGVARELALEGVRLNGVSPGVIDTDQQAGINEERRRTLLASIPLGRMGEPDEVARAVLWLLSEEASYITGSMLTIAGGR